MPNTEKRFKKGEIICRPKEMVMSMYNILYGSVGIYFDYGTPEQVDVVTLREGDFFNVISFLESRQRNTTAVALAAWLKADICQIFTDVDGVYDRDPRLFPDARRFRQIRYDTMMALVENGAQVLHDRSVELAREHGIRLEVLSALTGEPGTIVGELESF